MDYLFSIFRWKKSSERTPKHTARRVNDLLPSTFQSSDQRPFFEIMNSHKNNKTSISYKQYKINKTHKNQITQNHKNHIIKNDKKENTLYTRARTNVKTATTGEKVDDSWIQDSAATSSVTFDDGNFVSGTFKKFNLPLKVYWGNSSHFIHAEGRGDCVIQTSGKPIVARGVLFIPAFTKNILSIPSIRHKYRTIFEHDYCKIEELGTMYHGHLIAMVYIIFISQRQTS